MRSRWLVALVAAAFASADTASAGDPPREIAALIEALGTSDCRFQRNGRWYDAEDARAHLQRKYDYVRRRHRGITAEQFIEHAASRSSFTGRAYTVRCAGRRDEPSAQWLRRTLQALRGATPSSP